MPNRREFLTAAASAALLLRTQHSGAMSAQTSAPKPLRFLILGGTGNIGPYHVRAAMARGHRVAVFSRGKTRADLPEGVEHLVGDRNGDLSSIKTRDWDAVLDLATYGPVWVRTLGTALRGRVGHYTFISTVSVYDRPERHGKTTEDSPVLSYQGSVDPYSITDHAGQNYGALKVLCEREAEEQFAGRRLVLRPGYIGGPGDTHGALPYWGLRAEKGGEMLATGEPSLPVQYIDVRDMADWVIQMAERGGAGTYNVAGPASALNLAQLIETARAAVSKPPEVMWVPSDWLAAREDAQTWNLVRFWEVAVGTIMRMSNDRALAQGLALRSLTDTLADTVRWHKQQPVATQAEVRTGYRKKSEGSGWEPTSMAWPAYLQREQETLAAWRATLR